MTAKNQPRLLLVILALQLIIGTGYALTIPLWQSHEDDFFDVIRFWVNEGRYPTEEDYPEGEAAIRQATQPPLFMTLGYPFVALFHDDQPFPPPTYSGLLCIGGENANGLLAHSQTDARYNLPPQGTAAGGYALRMLNVALNLLTTTFIYLTARHLFPKKYSILLLAAGFFAFEPTFTQLSAMINNDVLLITISAANLYFGVRLLSSLNARDLIGLIICTFLALLTKLNGWVFLPLNALFLLFLVWQYRKHRLMRVLLFGIVGIVVLGVAIGIFNSVMYGSVFGRYASLTTSVMNLFDNLSITPTVLQAIFNQTHASYLEGLTNLHPRQAILTAYGLLPFIGFMAILIGMGIAARQRDAKTLKGFLLILLTLVLTSALVVYRNQLGATDTNTNAFNTATIFAPLRYYATAMPALAVGFAVGFGLLQSRLKIQPLGVGIAAVWLLVTLLSLQVLTAQQPNFSSLEALQAREDITFADANQNADGLSLVGYQVDAAASDGYVDLALYFNTARPSTHNYAINATLANAQGDATSCQFVPTRGIYPPSRWVTGQVIAVNTRIPNCVPIDPQTLTLSWMQLDGTNASTTADTPFLTYPLDEALQSAATCPLNLAFIENSYQLVKWNSPTEVTLGETYLPSLNWVVHNPLPQAALRVINFRHRATDQSYECLGSPSQSNHLLMNWEAGEYVYFDECLMQFPPDAPLGEYGVEVGIYNADQMLLAPGLTEVGAVTLRGS